MRNLLTSPAFPRSTASSFASRVACTAALAGALAATLPLAMTSVARAERPPTLEQLRGELASNDAARIQGALENAGLLGNPKVIPLIRDRIHRGLTPDLLSAALDTLAALGHPSSGPVIVELTLHRRPEVRRKAADTLILVRPPGAENALVTALSDEDSDVRRVAAEGLGALGARRAVPTLFHALDRGVLEAAASIGQVGNGENITALTRYLGRLPFSSMGPAFSFALARTDLSLDTKRMLITRLEELATGEVRTFLEAFGSSDNGGAGNASIRKAALEAAERIAR